MALPLVLAGPVVRRVDATGATFWIALSQQATVEARVWPGDQVSTAGGSVQSGAPVVAQSAATATRRYGEHLHIATVTASPTLGGGSLVPGALHAYDLTVTGHGGLKELGLLEDSDAATGGVHADAPERLALGYLPNRLPTFVTCPPTLPDLRLAHTSCRKPHGLGPDALAWLDDEIEDNRTSVTGRPHQLFLTGDQIYADDVAGPLLPMLTALSAELLGFDETVPLTGSTRVAVRDLPALRRARTVIEVGKLTSTASASHLLGFGEFAAMYLAAWSPRVWRPLADRDALFTEVSETHREERHLTDHERRHGSRADWRRADEDAESNGTEGTAAERARVLAYAATVPKVARVLASCPTYMVFDDHEVTDDWNISAQWRSRVLTSPLGRAVLRNGLMAYSAFQATGNEPAKWRVPDVGTSVDPPKEHLLLEATATLLADRAAPTTAHENEVDDLLGLTSPTAVPKVAFHYRVDGPRHRAVVLDTRTRRTFDSSRRHTPPKLMGEALDTMLPKGPLTDGRDLLVVVSAAPILFPRVFDALIQPLAAAVFDLSTHIVRTEAFDPARPRPALVGSEEWDVEGWGAHEPSFDAMVRRLGTYPAVVVLSGDVHFASSLACDVWTKGDDTCDSRILQCTSSAARNEPSPGQRAVLRGQRSAQRMLQGRAVERIGWDGDHGVVLPSGASIRPGRRGRLRRKPTVLPAGGWPAGTTLASDKPPDVRYRITVLRDERAATARGIGVPIPPTLPALGADPIAGYAGIAGAHQALLTTANHEPVRLMVFRSNVGLVTFAASGTADQVATHTILSPSGDGTTGSPYTAHSLDLARSAAAAPPTLVAGG